MTVLAVQENGTYVDGTFGLGGHAERLLEALGPGGRLLGIDRDAEVLELGMQRFRNDERVILEHGTFDAIPALLAKHGFDAADGILLDLGVSMRQLADESRGFSFRSSAPLDMRMDRSSGPTAADLVNRLPERELADLIFNYGEERRSRRIARAIVRARPLRTCEGLAAVIERAVPRGGRKIHPATRTFQALRIVVNRELEMLPDALLAAAGSLRPDGRLCVISYHSLEDRIVKQTFRELRSEGFTALTKKPVRPSREEVARNRASRSARLRALARPPAGTEGMEEAA